jgi:hypothetical protein
MRVNSALNGFCTYLLVMKSVIVSAMILSLIGTSASGASYRKTNIDTARSSETETPLRLKAGFDRDLRAKQANLFVRLIGHRLLMQSGDFTSRVLPVTEIKEGTFLLQFEKEFVFNHDSLTMLAHGLLPKTQFPSGYTVTVHDCISGGIVYGFQINNTLPDNLACVGRSQPAGCYTIEIAFPDLYKDAEKKDADISLRTNENKLSKNDPQVVNPKETKLLEVALEEANSKIAELKSLNVESREANPIPLPIGTEEFKATAFDYSLINLVFSGMLVSLGVTLLIARFGKIVTPVPVPDQNPATTKESVPEGSALGKFLFDVKGQRLFPIAIEMASEVISLTDKECKVLELLNENFGELIPRETLMQKIWINEGVITGRSLDMFISKLRKKLSSDPELKITNVHGKGYKLEMAGV